MNTDSDLEDNGFLIPPEWHRGSEAINDFFSTLRAGDSVYDELHWTIAEVLRWIAERTREAVDGPTLSEAQAQAAVTELHDALESGEIRATAFAPTEPLPRELPAETWSMYQLCLEQVGGVLRPFAVHDTTGLELKHVRLRRRDVLERWPPLELPSDGPPSTKGKETACKGWLSALMRANADQPRAKATVWDEASTKFPGLGKRAFNRAWTYAIEASGAVAWGAPGRRR